MEKYDTVVSGLPRALIFQIEELKSPKVQHQHLYQRLQRSLEILMNKFLMARLLSRQNQNDRGELLMIAYEMVVTMLPVWTHMDHFGRKDFDWMVRQKCILLLYETIQIAYFSL
jgi:hypothetical protein